ncbi:MAG: zinc ribbon domain-containing protein [Pseudomonadota bacterium]
MPTYEYQCNACSHQFEALQKMSDAPLTECPACGKPQLRKMMSAGAFHLKGSGWYQTDFKNAGKKKAEAADKKSGDGAALPTASTKETGGEAKTSATTAE